MSEYQLTPRTAFGATQARHLTKGACTLTERPDLALASVAARKGQGAPVQKQLETLVGGELGVAALVEDSEYSAFWTGPQQWFVVADHAGHEDLANGLKARLGDGASITEQNDGWVAFDLQGGGCAGVLERLCNIDLDAFPPGRAQRCVIDHVNAFVLSRATDRYRILCGRSYAQSMWHRLDTAMTSAAAIARLEES